LQDGFAQAEGDFPSLHEMFMHLIKGMNDFHYDWFTVTADETGPVFTWHRHTTEEWDKILSAMGTDITDMLSKRILRDV
jgi:hypothetical protein